MAFTNKEKAECAEREVKQREKVYPRWVADGRMTAAFADRQIAIMREIASEFRVEAEIDEAQGRLI